MFAPRFVLLTICLLSTSVSWARLPTDAEINEILEAHNRARSETANEEQVGNMPELVWSSANANIGAQYFQNNGCVFQHNPNRGNTGENLARGQRSWTQAIYDGWYESERDAYLSGSRVLNVIGHYTQVTWDRTLEVGCAICNENTYICNYSPPGNFNGLTAYQTGNAPCTTCASSHPQCTTGQFAGLCTNGTGGPPPAPPATTTQAASQPGQTNPPANGGGACGSVQEGIWHQDFSTFLDFAQSPSLDDCCSQCRNTTGCQAYTFGTLSGGATTQCALYGTPLNGDVLQASNANSANLGDDAGNQPPATDPEPDQTNPSGSACGPVQQSLWHQDFASFLDFVQSPSLDDCCSQCRNTNGCQAYTFGTLSGGASTQCALYGTPLNGDAFPASNADSANLA